MLIRDQSERDKARMLQRLGGARAIRNGVGTQDTLSVLEEDAGQGGDHAGSVVGCCYRKERKGGVEALWNESEGVSLTPEGESHHEQTQAKST